ncbi:phospholipid/cholesterol/gamma-HCH transport system ATP-binding protein [Nitrosomonas sp. PY1]|uniref:ABC transporter ATP-binding protein n=1 Tax=Nitrosomonas sp. PY1 TaxID=1803906 RepID=UPI001FC88C2A|nr:ATP-binding cassette domain-containing protein [Nitrosomonas sp. PY1]GKS69022.1 phospholipid/cholesterol/gamma-HCH transport system ATP-binding protein [Nitrosomonas sp. PY1]
MIDPAEIVIEITGLHTRFGKHFIHKDVNLTAVRGEILTLVGGSGSGKTTLLRQILGLEKAYLGSVKIFGAIRNSYVNSKEKTIYNRIGVLFQQGALFSSLTVFDNVALPLRELHTFDEDTIYDLVMMKLNMVAIGSEHADKMPAALSGGMIKRVALARALALDPELLFLDEPTAGLDPQLSVSFVKLIQSLRSEMNLTIIMITHDIETLIALSDRVAVLAEKRVIAVGTLDEISRFDHPFIVNFFNNTRKMHSHHYPE